MKEKEIAEKVKQWVMKAENDFKIAAASIKIATQARNFIREKLKSEGLKLT